MNCKDYLYTKHTNHHETICKLAAFTMHELTAKTIQTRIQNL